MLLALPNLPTKPGLGHDVSIVPTIDACLCTVDDVNLAMEENLADVNGAMHFLKNYVACGERSIGRHSNP